MAAALRSSMNNVLRVPVRGDLLRKARVRTSEPRQSLLSLIQQKTQTNGGVERRELLTWLISILRFLIRFFSDAKQLLPASLPLAPCFLRFLPYSPGPALHKKTLHFHFRCIRNKPERRNPRTRTRLSTP